ncbi:MAG TPA: hypothetical protein VF068_12165 [Rubrobacter sp.]
MRGNTASRLAWAVCAATLSLTAVTLVLILLGWSTRLPRGWTSWQEQALTVVGFIGIPIVGGLIASRRPANIYGWLWLGLGMGQALMQLGQAYAAYALVVEPGSLPAPRTIVTVLGEGWLASIVIVPFLWLLFPEGRLPSSRWRILAWVTVLVGASLLIIAPLAPGRSGMAPVENPIDMENAVGETIGTVIDPGILVLFVIIVISALSLVFRYRRASGIQRQQIKWFAYAAALNGFLVTIDTLDFSQFLGNTLWTLLSTIAFASLYAAVGIAVLRYRLYDIDVVINRTLVYGSLTATLIALYFGSVTLLQSLLGSLTGQESQLAVVASTLVIAALFNPLRHRIQSFIDRRFYRRKYDASKTLESFSAKLREETDLDALNDEMVKIVRETMQPEHVSLWLRPDMPQKGERQY